MTMKDIHLGNTKLHPKNKEVRGQFGDIQGEKFFKISNYNEMPDFFMTIVSDSDHWMFISSNGSLTAGRIIMWKNDVTKKNAHENRQALIARRGTVKQQEENEV